MKNEFIYNEYINLFTIWENFSHETKALVNLFNITKSDLANQLVINILNNILDDKGKQIRKITEIEKSIFLFHKNTILNNDGTLLYRGNIII